ISKGSFKLADLSWFIFHEFIPTTIQLVLTFILLLYEQWILGAIFALFLPIIAYITMYTSKEVQPYRRLYHERRDDAIGELGESLFNISTVKDYVQEKKQFHKFERMVADYLHHADKRTRYSFEILKWRDVLITIGRGGTLGIAAYMVLQGTLSAGSLVLVYALTERAFLSTYRIGRLYSYLEDAAEPIERLLQLFATKAMVKDKAGAKSVTKLKGKIEFVQGQFAYGDSKPVLHDINLSVKPKQVVALVGRSGSGKSTMVKLLLRNYDITGGDILIDGHPISKYKIKEYKKRVAVVSQNVEIFNRSVLDNILFANPKATRKDVITAAKKAHAHEFILEFDDGYDTIVGEKGIRLSGGQKQRISIARALLKNPDIYIFDEATSSLDSESEQYIQKSIFAIAGKKTTIIIAHRLSTIKHADVIVVMDKGRIIEQGSYRELIKKKGAFARMIRLQKISEIRD
ncbi:TPA: ABC transporter ATP-binding protein, partial [Candidatus Woesearchaeota archaeon]|nr:ABC transporter ATP-binding protein [Candidatus Woesearchaeota archaeon]